MRTIKMAAVQPEYLPIPNGYHYLSDPYANAPEEIFSHFIQPNMEVTTGLLEKAGQQGCDIVSTSEDATQTGNYCADISSRNVFPELVRLSYPVLESKLAEIARKYGMYIVGCYNKAYGNKIYNVASLFDRKGNICGEYRKTHLPPDEKWQVSEGDALEVFKLDFGTVGICICYDMMFQECTEVLALKGAEVIFHPTAGYGWYDEIGEATIRTRANDNSVYIVTSKNYRFNGAGKSSVVDYWGHVLVDACFKSNAVVFAEVDLDVRKTQPDWFNPVHMSGSADVRIRMAKERRPDLYGPIARPLQERFQAPPKDVQMDILNKMKTGQCRW